MLSLEYFKYHHFEHTWVSVALAVCVQSPKGCWMCLFEGNRQAVCEATYWGNSSFCAFHSGDPLAGTAFPGLSTGWILLASPSLLMTSLDPPHKSHLHFLHPVLVPLSKHHSPALLQWQVSEPGVDSAGTNTAHQPKQLRVLSFYFKLFSPITKSWQAIFPPLKKKND